MDCYSAESEFIESLDFLSPPVKRLHSREVFGSPYHNEANDVHLLRGLRNKFARRTPSFTKNTRTVKTNAESSTSLILKKTSERQILEQYSIVSYTSLQRPEKEAAQRKSDKNSNTVKPLIKVTVIPKADHIQTAKILRKRRYIPKKVQSTTSNHENSVQTKNVYLIVAGRRKEKIYEIKTTGSATFSTDHDNSNTKDDEIPAKELSNFKHLIQSLNMDRKKKKDKKASIENADEPQQSLPRCDNCFCNDLKDEDDDSLKRNRVRIFGQFGISEQDKYVLRYGATVNNKQVLSDVAQLTRDFSPILFPSSQSHDSISDENHEQPNDSAVQANNEHEVEQLTVTDKEPSKETQGTQVNFNVQIATKKMKNSKFANKKIQCSCCAVPNKSDNKTLKDCKSPLVIISVYPKQSPEDSTKSEPSTDNNNISGSSPSAMHTYTNNQVLKIDKGTKKSNAETKRNYKSPSVSRSPSPIKKSSRPKVQEDKSLKVPLNDKRSPDRQKALRAIKDKIQEKDKLKEAAARKSSRYNPSNETQVSRNLQNFTISNATQVSNRRQQFYTASNGTQVSARDRQNYTVSNATQYITPLNLTMSNGTQWVDSPQINAPGKLSKNTLTPSQYIQSTTGSITHPQIAHVSNATQMSKPPQQVFVSNSTQVSKNENTVVSNATQVSRNRPNFIPSRYSKNQETYTSFHKTPTIKTDQKLKPLSKLITERGTNTDHAQAKKALVDTYTKKLTEQMCQKDYMPLMFNNSKVTINIDGDKEYYDVLFNQDKISTDLTVRKTMKNMGSQKYYEEECSPSLDNLMFLPDCAVEKEPSIAPGNKSPQKTMPAAVYNNLSDAESPLTKHVSGLTIRDSLEISHRREDKSVHNNNNNIKNTQTCFTAQFADKIPHESEFLAPIKHYTGDDCSICDPIERDKQIRELLGVKKGRFTYAKSKQARNCAKDEQFPYQYIYRQECKKSQVTEINFQFQKFCPCFEHKRPSVQDTSRRDASVSVQCRNPECPQSQYNSYDHKAEKMASDTSVNKKKIVSNGKSLAKPVRFDSVNEENPAIYQQLILNRNIQVFLQVDQFSKQKPIILSRKQYNKVKKTIQKTICKKKSSHDRRKKLHERSEVSVGEVRKKKAKNPKLLQEKEAQTELAVCVRETCPNEKKKHLWKTKSRKPKSVKIHDSSDADDAPDQEKTRKTGRFDRNRKKQPSPSLSPENKGKENQIVEVCTVDQYCGKSSSWRSDQSYQNREKNNKLYAEQDAERIVTCTKKRDANMYIEQGIGCHSGQFLQSEEHSHRQCSLHKESHNPERHIERKANCSPDRYSRIKEIHSPERFIEIREAHSPERYSQIQECHGPDRYNSQDEEQNLQQYDESNEDLNNDVATENLDNEVKTLVLFNAENTKGNSKDPRETDITDTHTRRTMSSVEIRFASVAFMKQAAYSSTDVGAISDSSLAHVNSFHTIFRGHRKSPTPNLGTSGYSLYSEEELNSDHKTAKYIMDPRDSKPKKPFLRRLMSCLVMRSTRDSELKLPAVPLPDVPSVNSSIDSYHISTSLGAVEVSSSIYDTSASFYSNHTILPVNSKIKRGFFSSVRGFLTNRKS